MRSLQLASLVLLAVFLVGCTDDGDDAVTSVQGVNASTTGDVGLVAINGIQVDANNTTHAVRVGLGPLVYTQGAFVACGPACNATDAREGMIVADGSLLSHNDVALNSLGPDRDASIYFFDAGTVGGQHIRWVDAAGRFQISNATEIVGEVLAVGGPVGTATARRIPDENGAYVVTSALEGNGVTIYLRGSGVISNGTSVIVFPTSFESLVGVGDITVQVTLTSKGPTLWVSEKAGDHITVETVTPAAGPITFDYFVQASRVGGEGFATFR